MQVRKPILAVVISATAALSQGQAIVDATGATPGSVTTIGAALAGSQSEIIVKNTGLYNEALMITRSVILRGENPNDPPIVALQGNATQPTLGTGDGIYAGGTSGGSGNLAIEIRNFIFIPSLTNSIADDGFSITPNVGGNLNFTMDNVLCAPNNGSNQPTADSVWDNDVTGTSIPGAWFYLMGQSQFGGFDGNIIANVTNCTFIGAGTDATVFYPGTAGSVNVSGLGTSYSGRYATQFDNVVPVNITGTKENPSWVARKNAIGLIIFESGTITINNLIAVDNNNTGLRVDADTVETLNLSESLFVNNATQGLYIPFDPPGAKTWTVDDCTFVNNGTNTGAGVFGNIQITAAGPNLTLNVADSIFGGPSAPGIENLGTAVVNLSNSALITAGPQALPSGMATVGTINTTNVINADPVFASIATDPLVDASFDVTASAYATAGTGGTPLNGWGEGPSSSVSDWTLY